MGQPECVAAVQRRKEPRRELINDEGEQDRVEYLQKQTVHEITVAAGSGRGGEPIVSAAGMASLKVTNPDGESKVSNSIRARSSFAHLV